MRWESRSSSASFLARFHPVERRGLEEIPKRRRPAHIRWSGTSGNPIRRGALTPRDVSRRRVSHEGDVARKRRVLAAPRQLSEFHLFHYLFPHLLRLRAFSCDDIRLRLPAFLYEETNFTVLVPFFSLPFAFSLFFFTPAPTTSTCNYANIPNPRRGFRDLQKKKKERRNLEEKSDLNRLQLELRIPVFFPSKLSQTSIYFSGSSSPKIFVKRSKYKKIKSSNEMKDLQTSA